MIEITYSMADSHEPSNPTIINTKKMTVEAIDNPKRPQSPAELSRRLAGSLKIDTGIHGLTKEQKQISGQAWMKAHEDLPVFISSSGRRSSRGGILAGAAAVALALAATTGVTSPHSIPTAEGAPLIDTVPKSEAEKTYSLITNTVALVFNQQKGEILHTNIQRFNQPDGKTPQGDLRWTLDTNLLNPEFTPTNKQYPPKLNVVLRADSIQLNTNVAQLFPELRDPEAVKGADLRKVINTLFDKPEEYQVKVSERTGGGDDGAGDDMTAEAKATRDINGNTISVTVNSVGSLTLIVPKDLL